VTIVVLVADYATSYFLSKVAVELPLTFMQIVVQYTIVYNLVSFQGNFFFMVSYSYVCWLTI
jgi:hypothetical protein